MTFVKTAPTIKKTMKNIVTCFFILLFSAVAFAQKSNYVFFTENGEPFTLILNGISYNSSPQTNVKAEQLNPGNYLARIVFADASKGALNEQLYLESGVEVTFNIMLDKKSAAEKSVEKFGKGLFSTKPDSVIEQEKQQVDAKEGKYRIVFLSKTRLGKDNFTMAPQQNTSQQSNAELPPPAEYRGGGDPLKGLNVTKAKDMVVGNYYAVIIGIDKYKGKWPSLQNAVSDAKAVEGLLKERYKFDNFRTLYNEQATRKSIIAEMEWLVKNAKPEDNVFIYYSGHGEFKKELNKGFWVPSDAISNTTADYISNNDIQTYLGGIKSKHTLLVSDACFSGDLFRGNTVSVPFENSEKYYKEVHGLISRQAFTSGGIEPVKDGGKDGHSVFAYYFLKSLRENQEKYFDASQLYDKIKIPVVNNSDQTPKLAPLKDTGDEGGQFIFIKK